MSSVPRLSNNETRYRVHYRPPITKGGTPTWVVIDHLYNETVGYAGSKFQAAFICTMLSDPAAAPRVIDGVDQAIVRQLALIDMGVQA